MNDPEAPTEFPVQVVVITLKDGTQGHFIGRPMVDPTPERRTEGMAIAAIRFSSPFTTNIDDVHDSLTGPTIVIDSIPTPQA